MAEAKRNARSEAIRLADLVRGGVDEGATTVEEIHKKIAALPLEVLERLDVLEKTVKKVRKIQEESIGAVYDAIRTVNREAAKLATDLLERAPRRKVTAGRTRPKPKRGRASATA